MALNNWYKVHNNNEDTLINEAVITYINYFNYTEAK
jgi:hypothetical protein